MKRPTILIDLTSLDDNFSGIEKYALNISKEIIKNNSYNFLLLFKNKIPSFDIEFKKDNIKSIIIKGNRYSILLFGRNKIIKKYKPDYVFFPAFPPSFLFSQKKVRKIIVIHDLVCFDVPLTMKFFSRIYFKISISRAIKSSFIILTDSLFSRDRIKERFKRINTPIYIIPCGCEYSSSDYSIKPKTILPSKYVLSLSTIEPRKNIPFILKNMNQLWKEGKTDLDFVMVGRNGWGKENLLDYISPEFMEKIHFTGFVEESELPNIYRNSSLFVFSSIYEGFGMPVLECIRYGTIPLCSNIPTNIEILGEDYPYIYRNECDFKNMLISISEMDINQKNEVSRLLNEKTKEKTWKNSAALFYKCLESREDV